MRRLSPHERLQQRRLIDRAIAQLQQGRPGPAEADLNALLLRWPGQGDALHFPGVLRHQQGRSSDALELLNRASLALQPGQAACAAAGLVLAEPEPFVLRFEHGTGMPGWLGVGQRPVLDQRLE